MTGDKQSQFALFTRGMVLVVGPSLIRIRHHPEEFGLRVPLGGPASRHVQPSMVIVPKSSSRMTTTILSVCILFMFMYSVSFLSTYYHPTSLQTPLQTPPQTPSPPKVFEQPEEEKPSAWQNEAKSIIEKARSFIDTPIRAPYKDKFYDVGQRTQIAREWVKFLDSAGESDDKQTVKDAVESAIGSLFPFIQNSPKRPDSTTPFTDVRSFIEPGSRGIVIPTGKATMRYAAHLIGSLREVLHTKLAIQIVYAGDEDFPAADRERLQARFEDVEFLDILSVLDDTTVQLATGGWAIKAFAALYSPFEEVILMDADSVFLQVPEKLYSIPSYISTGVLLFHDRLLWQHAFTERHEWWRSQIHEPSATLNKSLVWTEDYAEEGDSGVVVIDKSRLDVLMGLLHVAWQNTHAVREEVTYVMTYGDKESWWFGFELSGASYSFEKHYGAMVGWVRDKLSESRERICSFVIGHVDDENGLLWYNGGLLKNKKIDAHEFGLPTHTMVDGTWEKGARRTDMSCMVGPAGKPVDEDKGEILERSVALAQELDDEFDFV